MREEELSDGDLVLMLRGLRKLAEIKRRAVKWAYSEMLEDGSPPLRPMVETWRSEMKSRSWEHYAEPVFKELVDEANRRDLAWDCPVQLDEEIDLSMRGPLERQIVGALRDCVNAHGPITRDNAHSAAKRVIGAIKTFNRKARRHES